MKANKNYLVLVALCVTAQVFCMNDNPEMGEMGSSGYSGMGNGYEYSMVNQGNTGESMREVTENMPEEGHHKKGRMEKPHKTGHAFTEPCGKCKGKGKNKKMTQEGIETTKEGEEEQLATRKGDKGHDKPKAKPFWHKKRMEKKAKIESKESGATHTTSME